jgi:hypothetical protein
MKNFIKLSRAEMKNVLGGDCDPATEQCLGDGGGDFTCGEVCTSDSDCKASGCVCLNFKGSKQCSAVM